MDTLDGLYTFHSSITVSKQNGTLDLVGLPSRVSDVVVGYLFNFTHIRLLAPLVCRCYSRSTKYVAIVGIDDQKE